MKVGSVLSLSEAILVLLIRNKIKRIFSELGNVDFEILYVCSNIASIESCIWASSVLTEKSPVLSCLIF